MCNRAFVQGFEPGGAEGLFTFEVIVEAGAGDFACVQYFTDADIAVAFARKESASRFNDVGSKICFPHIVILCRLVSM